MSGSAKNGCCCGGEINPCLIHSTILSKSKPWAAWSLVSGVAPTEIDDGFQFTAPGKITLPHDARKSWRPDTDTFINDPAPHELKRVLFNLWLDDADSYVVVTFYTRTGEHAKAHFKSWTPPTAHYAIFNVWLEWLHVDDGTGYESDQTFTSEVICDKYEVGQAIIYNNAAAFPGGIDGFYYYGPAFTWAPVSMLGGEIHPGWAPGRYAGTLMCHYPDYSAIPADNLQIAIECVNGTATIRNLELYQDPAQWEGAMDPALQTVVPSENGDGCPGAWANDAYTTGCSGSGGQGSALKNSIPNAVELIMPTLEANPAWNGVSGPCADCSVGGGGHIFLFTDPLGALGVPAIEDPLCTFIYAAAGTTLGCHSIDYLGAQVMPWHDAISGDSPFVGIDYEGFPFRFTTDLAFPYDGSINPLADHLAWNGLGYVVAYNMALLIDNADTSGAMVWESALSGSVNACWLPGGGPVLFRLPSSFTFGPS